jgi:hypothetical protein
VVIVFAGGPKNVAGTPVGSAFGSNFTTAQSAPSCVGTGARSISGSTKTSSGAAIPGVTLTLTGPNGCGNNTTSSSTGTYQFSSLASGAYVVTATKTGCTFSPSLNITITNKNVTNKNFTGTCQ